jgi:hypothetical protein
MQALSLGDPAERALARAVFEAAVGRPECLMMLERVGDVNCKDAEV